MSDETIQEMHRVLEMQKALNISEGAPDIKLRKDRLDRVIAMVNKYQDQIVQSVNCLLYTSPSPRDATLSRMPSSA